MEAAYTLNASNKMSVELRSSLLPNHDNHDNDNDTVINFQSNPSFFWLDKLLLLFPMWSIKTSDHNRRSKCLSIIIIIITILSILYHLIFTLRVIFKVYGSESQITFIIIYCIVEILFTSARFMQIIHFWNEFNFPWHSNFNPANYSISKYKLCIQFMTILIFIFNISDLIYLCIQFDHELIFYSTMTIGRIFLYFPICLVFPIQSVIFLKYHLSLKFIIDSLKNDKLSMKDIFIKYQQMYKMYLLDHPYYLNISIQCVLLTSLFAIKLSFYGLINLGQKEYITDFCLSISYFATFIIFASMMNETFEKLDNLLFEMMSKYVENNDDNDHVNIYGSQYNFLLLINFVSKHSINANWEINCNQSKYIKICYFICNGKIICTLYCNFIL